MAINDTFADFAVSISALFKADMAQRDPQTERASVFSAFHGGNFLTLSASSRSVALCRNLEQIAVGGVDHLAFLLNNSGDCVFDAEGRQNRVAPGDILLIDLSRPITLSATNLAIIMLIVPRCRVRLPHKILDVVHGSTLRAGSSIGRLLGRHLLMTASIAPECLGADLDLAAEIVDSLATVAISAASLKQKEEQPKILTHSVQLIQAHIERNLSDVNLNPEGIGRHFGLSRSALYRLFQPLGGIADYIRDRRLRRAMLHVGSVGTGRGAVAKLALQCGFPSESAFSRAFRQQFGLAPKEAIARNGTVPEETDAHPHQTPLLGWLKDLSNAKPRHRQMVR